jgi:hypothetical protein
VRCLPACGPSAICPARRVLENCWPAWSRRFWGQGPQRWLVCAVAPRASDSALRCASAPLQCPARRPCPTIGPHGPLRRPRVSSSPPRTAGGGATAEKPPSLPKACYPAASPISGPQPGLAVAPAAWLEPSAQSPARAQQQARARRVASGLPAAATPRALPTLRRRRTAAGAPLARYSKRSLLGQRRRARILWLRSSSARELPSRARGAMSRTRTADYGLNLARAVGRPHRACFAPWRRASAGRTALRGFSSATIFPRSGGRERNRGVLGGQQRRRFRPIRASPLRPHPTKRCEGS